MVLKAVGKVRSGSLRASKYMMCLRNVDHFSLLLVPAFTFLAHAPRLGQQELGRLNYQFP